MAAGTDPLTGKRHDLTEVVPTKPAAEKMRTKLLAQVDERRNARTKATVNRLLDRYLEVLDVGQTTRRGYVGYIDNHIRPALGDLQVGRLDGEALDSFYAQLRHCRARCGGRRGLIDHRVSREHECDERCVAHVCQPLAASTVRQIHWILSGALGRAVRWKWITSNPVDASEPPSPPAPDPQPPSPDEAARILQAAWDEDTMWGTLIWLVMTTGARRGEICAIRRSYVDLDRAILTLPRSVTELGRQEKDTKTHQRRRISLDSATVDILRAHFADLEEALQQLDAVSNPQAFIFSFAPGGEKPIHPSTLTHRYGRLVKRLNIDTTLRKLRHYNATELIAAGVDIRTVAGRLGRAGGGTTTLRVYAAWVSEADQRAAGTVSGRLPRRPVPSD